MSAPLPWRDVVLDDRRQGIAERTSPWRKATLSGLGNETAAVRELVRVAQLLARLRRRSAD